MWLLGWAVRVLLLITAPIYYLSRFLARTMGRLDAWSWKAIHADELKKPAQPAMLTERTQRTAGKYADKWKVLSGRE